MQAQPSRASSDSQYRWRDIYEHAFRSLQKAKGDEAAGLAEQADDFRRVAAHGAASTVLAPAENLPKIVDAASVQADVE